MNELSSHCLCDKCSGDDCSAVAEINPDAIRKAERKKVLDILDKRCKICAKEHCTDEEKGVFAIDLHRDPFNEVREWIKELRKFDHD